MTEEQIADAMPRAATGSAVDPIALEPVEEIVITTLVDNVYDALLTVVYADHAQQT